MKYVQCILRMITKEIKINEDADEIIQELFDSLLCRYSTGFDYVDGLPYKCHKVGINQGGFLCIDSTEWIKSMKATINPQSNDNNCFQIAGTATLNHESIGKNP